MHVIRVYDLFNGVPLFTQHAMNQFWQLLSCECTIGENVTSLSLLRSVNGFGFRHSGKINLKIGRERKHIWLVYSLCYVSHWSPLTSQVRGVLLILAGRQILWSWLRHAGLLMSSVIAKLIRRPLLLKQYKVEKHLFPNHMHSHTHIRTLIHSYSNKPLLSRAES